MSEQSSSDGVRDHESWARAVMSGYDDVAEAYDADRRPDEDTSFVESIAVDLPEDGRVLDAGCGGGRAVLETLADDAVDALTALHSVIHVPREHHERVFAEFARVLRPCGRLLVTTGVGEWEGENDDWLDSGAEMRWSFHGREASLELLDDAGFDVEDDTVVGDELGDGGGEWLFVTARLRV